jgi:maltose/moltooligosaccharide transporter
MLDVSFQSINALITSRLFELSGDQKMDTVQEQPVPAEGTIVKEKLPWRTILPFGFLLAGWSSLWAVYNNFVPVFLQAGNPVFDRAGAAVTFGFGLSAFTAGLLMSVDNFFSLVSGPVIGRISDRMGKRLPFIRIGVPMAIASFIALPFVIRMISEENNGVLSQLIVPFMILAMLMLVIVVGAVFSGVPAYALRYQLIPSKVRSQSTGYIELIGSSGSLLAYGLAGVLYARGTFLPFVVFGFLFALAIFYFLKTVKEPTDWVPAAETTVQGRSFKEMANVFKDFTAKEKKNIFLIIAVAFSFNFGIGPIATYGSSYVVNVLGLSEGTAATMGAVFFLGYLLGTVPMGYLPKWITRRGTLMFGALLSVTSALVILFVPNFTVLIAMIGIMGFGSSASQVTLYPVMSDILPDQKSFGSMIGLMIFSLALATTISVPFWGKMIDVFSNYELVWVAVVSAGLMAALISSFLTMGEPKTGETAR